MCQRRALCIARLTNRCEQRRDGRTDVVAEQNRNRTGQAEHACHAVRHWLRCKVLQHGNGRRAGLDNQRHQCADQHAQRRNMCYLLNQMDKNRAACQRLHNRAHGRNADKQQAKRENRLTDVFQLFLLRKEIQHKADKDNRPNKIVNAERDNLRSHRCTDIGAEDDRNRLRQRHQSCTDKADDHNGGRRAALQHCGNERTGKHADERILRQNAQYLFHFFAGCLLQTLAHQIHAVNEYRKTAEQSGNGRYHFLIHNDSPLLILPLDYQTYVKFLPFRL